MQIDTARLLACVEIGGGGTQTVLFTGSTAEVLAGAVQPEGALLAIAVPGYVEGTIVREASNLGWIDVDPVVSLGLKGPALVVLNDAEAAALGEAALRDLDTPLVYVGVGTGIGGAVVEGQKVVRSNLFGHNAKGHGRGFGDDACPCGRTGCLETVAAGWALPSPLSIEHLEKQAAAIAAALTDHELAQEGPVVVGGGIARAYPELIRCLQTLLPARSVEPSRAPADAKSASAWGLRRQLMGVVT